MPEAMIIGQWRLRMSAHRVPYEKIANELSRHLGLNRISDILGRWLPLDSVALRLARDHVVLA